MSVIIAAVSSALLGVWAENEKEKANKSHNKVDHLRSIPVVPVSCLNYLVPHQDAKKLVFVRGCVMPAYSANPIPPINDATHQAPASSEKEISVVAEEAALCSTKIRREALVVEEKITHIYTEEFIWRTQGTFKVVSKKRKQVPFVIVDQLCRPCTQFVVVNLEDVDHQQIPLQVISSNQRELHNHVKLGISLQVDVVTEEAILPRGSVVSAVGIFSTENGVPTIKPCDELDYFLTSKSMEDMITELRAEADVISKSADFLTALSYGLAGYAITTVFVRFIRNSI